MRLDDVNLLDSIERGRERERERERECVSNIFIYITKILNNVCCNLFDAINAEIRELDFADL